jgi:NADH dehydrogenase (ubiquinone) 1 alpha subcomplex subunit 13
MSSGAAFKQDLPPPGGYKPIQYLRVPAKSYFSGVTIFVVFNIIQFGGLYIWSIGHAHRKRLKVEDRAARMVLQPLLLAEKDRLYLKRCRQLRDEEEELMKNVPGWVVGTYWGEPVYHTRPANEWHDITDREFFAHTPDFKYAFFRNFYKYM